MEDNYQILNFYGWWQFIVCLFAFLGLIAIWYHIGRKQKDFGQVWLAMSILSWSISGAVLVYHTNVFSQLDTSSQSWSINNDIHLNGWLSIFSLLNSLFILLALPWFKHIPTFLLPIVKSKFWSLIVGLPFLFSLLPTIRKMYSGAETGTISELDVYYSTLTLIVLGIVLWWSFVKRRLVLLAILSVVCILITFTAQLYKLTDNEVNQTLFSAIFKTSLIMIFFALALSWVKDLTEKIYAKSSNVFLHLFRVKKNANAYSNKLGIKGVNGGKDHVIELSNKNFELMTKFMEKKINDDEGWLEIKPKKESRTGKLFDINDHNEIKRLTQSILDGIYGKGLWTKPEHEAPLKSILFEMSNQRERKIRINIPKENLKID